MSASPPPDDPRDRDDATPLPPPDRQSALDMAHDMPQIPLAETVRAATGAMEPLPKPGAAAGAPAAAASPTQTGQIKPIAKAGSTLPSVRAPARPSPMTLAMKATTTSKTQEVTAVDPKPAGMKSSLDVTAVDVRPAGIAATRPAETTAVDAKPAGTKAKGEGDESTFVERTEVDSEPVRESAAKLDAPPSGPVKQPTDLQPRLDTESEPTAVDRDVTKSEPSAPSDASSGAKSSEARTSGTASDAASDVGTADAGAADGGTTAADADAKAKPDPSVKTDRVAKSKPGKAKAKASMPPAPTEPIPANPPWTPEALRGARLAGLGLALLVFGGIISIGTLFGTTQVPIIGTGIVIGVAGIAVGFVGMRIYPWGTRDFYLDAGDLAAREGALPALIILTGVMVYVYSGIFGGALIGDDLTFHMAESRRIASCLSVGDFDWWNPSANGGFASAYYYQVLPQLASAIPAAIFGVDHFLFFFQLSVFLPLVLAPAAAYRGMRLLGASPWQAFFAAVAVGFMNGESRWGAGNAGTFQVGLYTQTWALAALPLALGHVARFLREGRHLAPAIFWGTFVWLCHPFSGISLVVIVFIGFIARAIAMLIAMVLHAIAGPKQRDIDPDRNPLYRSWFALVNRWSANPARWMPVVHELGRAFLLGTLLVIAWAPVYVPLLADKAGFGGFPHRVGDEVGPGFTMLWQWWKTGAVMDFTHAMKFPIITWLFPAMFLLARGPFYRFFWWPAILFALLLGLGPHVGTTQNDLIPAVRFLGAMQICIAMGVGAGIAAFMRGIWTAKPGSIALWWAWIALLVAVSVTLPLLAWVASDAPVDAPLSHFTYFVAFHVPTTADGLHTFGLILFGVLALLLIPTVFFFIRSDYAIRTTYAAIAAASLVFVLYGHGDSLRARVHTLPEYDKNHPAELADIINHFDDIPPGRRQAGPGTENHWWNQLPYVYADRPTLLQMGGGGLQASPNYDFLWNTIKQYVKLAWLYDAPYLLFQSSSAAQMPVGKQVYTTEHYELRRIRGGGLVAPIAVTGSLPAGDNGPDTPMRKAAIAWIKSDEPERDRFLVYPGYGPPSPSPGDGRVNRVWRQDSSGDSADIVAETYQTTPTTYVVRESWHPRWHAYVDGTEVPIRRVTPDFSAVDITAPGKHVLAMRFERPWWVLASWALWPLLTLGAWWILRRRKPATTTAAATV